MEAPKYINLLHPAIINRIVTIKIELTELAGTVSGSGDSTLIALVENASAAVNKLDDYTMDRTG